METARQLKEACGVSFIYRAGAWKPRTSPHTFQGVGEEALEWLQEVKTELGLPVATEVAAPEHVQAALKAGIDYLWIGARTSANPMAVSVIADAITGRYAVRPSQSDCKIKGIFIKNPVNEDAGLWIGNIERLEKTGVPVMAVHRGCGHKPCWAMAHKVRLARPDVPMLLDPSHMSGDAKRVPELMQKIPELGLDGAMVEVHCRPEEALSDSVQQITPITLGKYLDSFTTRCRLVVDSFTCLEASHAVKNEGLSDTKEVETKEVDTKNKVDSIELNWLRAEIDELDEALWDTIAARMDVSKRIGEWKKAHGVAPLQPGRYEEIVEKLKMKNEKLKTDGISLSEEFMMNVWEMIHEESLRQQE